jgi:hypothetical protein
MKIQILGEVDRTGFNKSRNEIVKERGEAKFQSQSWN